MEIEEPKYVQNIQIPENIEIELSCIISGSNINKFRWIKDKKNIHNKQGFNISPLKRMKGIYNYGLTFAMESTLRIKVESDPDCKLRRHFGGIYQCEVIGTVGVIIYTATSPAFNVYCKYFLSFSVYLSCHDSIFDLV